MTGERGKSRPQAVGDILPAALAAAGLDRRLAERSALDDWAQVAGERVAAHSRAVDLRDGVLVLDADHGVWRLELTLLFPAIMRKYNERRGEGTVREIRWLHRERAGGYRGDAGRGDGR
jgi:predicted nucleic acid-binding Zn ribbon protein